MTPLRQASTSLVKTVGQVTSGTEVPPSVTIGMVLPLL